MHLSSQISELFLWRQLYNLMVYNKQGMQHTLFFGSIFCEKNLFCIDVTQCMMWILHFTFVKSQSHIHDFGPGRATVHPDLSNRGASARAP